MAPLVVNRPAIGLWLTKDPANTCPTACYAFSVLMRYSSIKTELLSGSFGLVDLMFWDVDHDQ